MFSQQHYDFILRCLREKKIPIWKGGLDTPPNPILLESADLTFANLSGCELVGAHLERAKLDLANLQNAHLLMAHLEEAHLDSANLEHARLGGAHLQMALLAQSNLQGAELVGADLRKANFVLADLRGADFRCADLRGANLRLAKVDGDTMLIACKVDRDTDARGVGLSSARIDAGTREALEYNARRKNWEEWYSQHWWRQPVRAFWWLSDYGTSSLRVVGVFFVLAFLFANIYCNWGLGRDPGLVSDLFADGKEQLPPGLIPIRVLYFSIVTMTTLGFGDMRAAPRSISGHMLISMQVLSGYLLLGALITRLGILFTSGGPGG